MNIPLHDWWRVLSTPACWMQNATYSQDWDRELTRLLDAGYRFVPDGQYRAQIGPYLVWTANYPYAAFTHADVRPRRVTILRAQEVLMRDRFPVFAVREIAQNANINGTVPSAGKNA